MNPEVDWFFSKDTKWQEEYNKLRKIILDTGLVEELKWGCPCYSYNGKNIVLIHGFKDYCALLFFKGVLLGDPEGLLIQQTPNVQGPRQMRFTSLKEINQQAAVIKSYVYEAIEVEKAGLEIKLKKPAEFEMAEEFKEQLEKVKGLKKAFESLTPGRQRAYLLHFSTPKLSKTRMARVEKSIPQILEGKGLDD
ncbi:hypothetical protein DVR12_02010 [Chitinophaga silvatica]|uniref:YdhG-like domain-containing protein n=2 Tax=Chitinophaga silvatica TaxID=2282649 RepID=A0A3E1YIG9_9BACT|nr:hypothetical protein DVR12_02010 [Chitinophaga silvatica]